MHKKNMSKYLDLCKQYNFPVSKNAIGSSGENIAKAILEFFPFFKVVFLGEKFPTVDFYVEIDEDEKSYPFLVQVKTTTSLLTKDGALRVAVSNDNYKKLHRQPVPTYVGGIHLDTSKLYIVGTKTEVQKLNSINSNYVLSLDDMDNCVENLCKLKNDVKAYWDGLQAFERKMMFESAIK